ncbi:membrane protein [Marinospirillum insulare]|uniref:Membrane protein n=2 Tax=Marinospirillum insulare TaxID=217169 RepID=A0ABQ5ZZ50_9GAMM|nr:membrane protein [Marinospirillum insulare]
MLARGLSSFLLGCCCLLAFEANAQAKGIVSLQVENDALVGLDKHYTSGVLLSYFPLTPAPDWAISVMNDLGLKVVPDKVALEYSIGNTIFTPKDFESTEPLPDQRPWAGHTFASLAIMRKPKRLDSFIKVGDKLNITLGHAGPASGGEWGQKKLHEIIGSPKPGGWQHQIGNETTFNLHYFRKWQVYQQLSDSYELEWSPLFSLALGSPYTYASLGFTLRLGPDLRQDYGPPSIQPNYPGSSYFSPGHPWNWYLVAGMEYRYMHYNLFLDGPVFRDGPSIEKYRNIDDFFVGGAVSYEKVRLGWTAVSRSIEFLGQAKRDYFGSLNLSYYY